MKGSRANLTSVDKYLDMMKEMDETVESASGYSRKWAFLSIDLARLRQSHVVQWPRQSFEHSRPIWLLEAGILAIDQKG